MIGTLGLALFLSVGTCLGYVVPRSPGGGSDYKPHLSQFLPCLSKGFLTVGPQWGVVLTYGAMSPVCILLRCLGYQSGEWFRAEVSSRSQWAFSNSQKELYFSPC